MKTFGGSNNRGYFLHQFIIQMLSSRDYYYEMSQDLQFFAHHLSLFNRLEGDFFRQSIASGNERPLLVPHHWMQSKSIINITKTFTLLFELGSGSQEGIL